MAKRSRRTSSPAGRGGVPVPTRESYPTYPLTDPYYGLEIPRSIDFFGRADDPFIAEREALRPEYLKVRAPRPVFRTFPRATGRTIRPDPVWRLRRSEIVKHPKQVMFCVRRKLRREALFRRGIAGHRRRRSPGRGGHYRRSFFSQWRC